MSKAVSAFIFMEDYTFDLNPTDHRTLNNQTNMCAYKPIAAWEAGRCSFCQVLGFFRVKYVQMLFGTLTKLDVKIF